MPPCLFYFTVHFMLSLSPWSVLFLFPCLLFRFHVVCSSFLRFDLFSLFFVPFSLVLLLVSLCVLFFVPFSLVLFPFHSFYSFSFVLLFFPPLSVFTFLFPSVCCFSVSFVPFSPLSVFSCFPRSAPSSVAAWAFSS